MVLSRDKGVFKICKEGFLLILLCFFTYQSCKNSSSRPNSNTILKPSSNETVGSKIYCEGAVVNISREQYYWLVVEMTTNDHQKLFWPKEPEIRPDSLGYWYMRIFEDGESKVMNLVLFGVNETGHKAIKKWFDEGINSGEYPAFEAIPGGIQLARVENLQVRPK